MKWVPFSTYLVSVQGRPHSLLERTLLIPIARSLRLAFQLSGVSLDVWWSRHWTDGWIAVEWPWLELTFAPFIWQGQGWFFLRTGQQIEWRWRSFGIKFGKIGYPCRVCGERRDVLSWPDDNPGATICYECCEHEDVYHDRYDGYCCNECGATQLNTDW